MTWSPNGQMVAVTIPDDSNQGYAWHVSLVNVATQAISQPAPSQTSNFDPVWSAGRPEGRVQVFRRDADLYVMSARPVSGPPSGSRTTQPSSMSRAGRRTVKRSSSCPSVTGMMKST
jgi:hypothetical protein